MEIKKRKVLGYDISLVTFEEAVEQTKNAIAAGQKMHIVTINPEMIELANKDLTFSNILKTADLVIPDGSGIKLALVLKGIKQEQIPGIDFSKAVISECSKSGFPVALIGSKEEVVNKAVQNLKNEFKGLKINYFRDGYFKEDEEPSVIDELIKSDAKFVLVALGAPKQEVFIRKCLERYPNAVYIGVGGSFDVWAGKVDRAPAFFRIIGCEWLYRTLTQPQRIKRVYKTLPIYLFKIIIEAILKK